MWKKFLKENLEMILIALAIVLPIRFFVMQPFVVHGSSMEPTYLPRDYIIVDEISYRFRAPERFEVVVFKAPNTTKQYYIKRIIGLPNEEVIIKDGKVTVITPDNQLIVLDEIFLPEGVMTNGSIDINLGPDQYFLLGDNRFASYDSRHWGPISREAIIGRAWLRFDLFSDLNQ